MLKISSAFSLTSLLLLSGCATPTYEYVPRVSEISRPPLGTVATSGVGEKMLEQGRFVEREALKINKDVRIGSVGSYTFTKGHFVKVGGSGAIGFYNESQIPGSGSVRIGLLTDPFQVIEYNKDTRQMCGVTILNFKGCVIVPDAELISVSALDDRSFQQTLIYSGRVGNKINIGYREFSGDIARPAFNNDVEYDLTSSKIIGYQGAEIEVIEADNRSITYRVIRNFNNATK